MNILNIGAHFDDIELGCVGLYAGNGITAELFADALIIVSLVAAHYIIGACGLEVKFLRFYQDSIAKGGA